VVQGGGRGEAIQGAANEWAIPAGTILVLEENQVAFFVDAGGGAGLVQFQQGGQAGRLG
jgi:hypothetical protein